ncbi:glycosyltransferase [Brachyspira intermedia]|uniref:glycosyltransferase n=1 Tax=Brachyspira intermedia TaxID=84377 RepID=UPI003007327E
MDICFVCNGHVFAVNMGITIVSILKNSDKDDKFHFHIISDDISEEDKNSIILLKEIKDFDITFYMISQERINMYKKLIEISNGNFHPFFGHTVMYKFEISNLNLDKVLLLDIDLIVLKSLKEVFNTNINDYCIAAPESCNDCVYYSRNEFITNFLDIKAKDKDKIFDGTRQYVESFFQNIGQPDKNVYNWVSAGFILINVKKFREIFSYENLESACKYISNIRKNFAEEEIINLLLKKDSIKVIDKKHHMVSAIWLEDKYIDEATTVHCSGGKIYSLGKVNATKGFVAPIEKNKAFILGWKYLMMTR